MAQDLKQQAEKSKFAGPVLVAAGILLSRIFGLIRERVFAHYFGQSDAGDAFKAGLKIPNFLQNLLGEGVLSASFIPVYAKLLVEKNAVVSDLPTQPPVADLQAAEVASVIGSIVFIFTSLLVIAGVWATPFLIDLIAPGFAEEKKQLTIHIVEILFPGVGFLVLSAWCLGILNSHGKFFLSYVAPVIWNLAMILSLVLFAKGRDLSELALILSYGLVVGSFLQFFVQFPVVLKVARGLRWNLNYKNIHARQVFKSFVPVVVSRGVVQVSSYADNILASFLASGAVSTLAYMQTLYLLPISLFGMSISAAELPAMSKLQSLPTEDLQRQLHQRLVQGLESILFFIVPTVCVFVFFPQAVVSLLFRTGAFAEQQVLIVSALLSIFSLGLLVTTQSRLLSSLFYSLRLQKVPLRWALARVSVSLLMAFVFVFILHLQGLSGNVLFLKFMSIDIFKFLFKVDELTLWGQGLGLALASTASAFVEYWGLKSTYQKKYGKRIELKSLNKIIVAGLGASLLTFIYIQLIHISIFWLQSLLILSIFAGGYFVAGVFLKLDKALQIKNRLVRRR
ncbi:MAG: murein biosynthesis integral membrane protein MurJ [Pseudobdellovibrionaceae bacterium]